MKIFRSLLCLPLIFSFCAKNVDEQNALAQVGNTVIDRDALEAFRKTTRVYPAPMGEHFPGSRQLITFMVETQALYAKAGWSPIKSKIRSSLNWKWKQRYFPAQLFVGEFLAENMGVTEAEQKAYYDSRKESFKSTIKVDTTGRDSVVYQSLPEVKDRVIEELFWAKYQPDSAFFAGFGESPPDSATMKREWLNLARNSLQDFFMKRYYQEAYGKPYPDSIDQFFGEGKTITPEDMDVILSWVPEDRREQYKTPQGTKELAEWLLKWKVFSEKAAQTKFSATPAMKAVIDWAWKIEIATQYVSSSLLPKAQKSAAIDSAMALYSYYDLHGVTADGVDSANLKAQYSSLTATQVSVKLDSLIYVIRKNKNVKFLQSDWKDEKVQNPEMLLARADSLRDTGNVDESENLYRTLSTDFPFSSEGKKATVELAKIQTEKQMYQQAIGNYRNYLISGGTDSNRKCNTFFMIGFIYDEYLDKPDMAEVNYKWLLKNTPDCELADDAEFMMLHLGEPMSSVEELQAEARRQGRKIEPLEEDTLEMQIDPAPTSKENQT